MKKVLIAISFIFSILIGKAQTFEGFVVENDSVETPLFQANVAVTKANQELFVLKTYFDGKFSFKSTPNTTYLLLVSYPGRKDTTVTITTDKKGLNPFSGKKIKLKKDGMRLLGKLVDKETDLPIQAAGLTLKNIMTRKEDKIITQLDGTYNFKLDYETNYLLKLDKRSPGIMNKFQDTSLYISTIGFNLPLDFVMDIYLNKTTEKIAARPEYDPYKKPENQILKPVVEVRGIKDSAMLTAQIKEINTLKEQLRIKDSLISSYNNTIIASLKSNMTKPQNTVAQKDNATQAKALAEIKAKEEKQKETERIRKELEEKNLAEAKKRNEEKLQADLDAKLLNQKLEKELSLARNKNEELEKQAAEKKRIEELALLREQALAKAAREREAQIASKRNEEDSLKEALKRELLMHQEFLANQQASIEAKQLQEKVAKEQKERAAIQNKLNDIEERERLAILADSKRLEQEVSTQRSAYEENQNDMIAYYENKLKEEKSAQKTATTQVPISNVATDNTKKQTEITGRILNGVTNSPIPNVSVNIRKENSIFSSQSESKENGEYSLSIENGNIYLISYFKEGFALGKQMLDLTQNEYSDYKIPDFYIIDQQASAQKTAVAISKEMQNVQFSKNNSNINPLQFATLIKIIKELKAKPESKITLYGLASKDEDYAEQLGTSRTREVARFLMDNGIKSFRITSESLGATKSISKCGTQVPCTEADLAKDRTVLLEIN